MQPQTASAAHAVPPSPAAPKARAEAPEAIRRGALHSVLRVGLIGFFEVYYRYAGALTAAMPWITLDGTRIYVPSTVYKPLENEHRYREFVDEGDRVCDLGCGSGVISVFVAEKASEVVALDISPSAVRATRENCERLGIDNVTAFESDMFAAAEGTFDVICANPPFVEIPPRGDEMQWATSVSYLTRLFSEGRDHLAPGGRIVALYPKAKTRRLTAFAEAAGFELVERQPVGPKSLGLWLTCALYMELLFDAQFHVFKRRSEG